MAYPPQQQPLTRQQRFDEQDRADQEFANQQQALRIQQQRADADVDNQALQMQQFAQQSLYQQQQMAEAQRASVRADEQAQRQKDEFLYTQGRRPAQEERERLLNATAQQAFDNNKGAVRRADQTAELQAAAEKRAADAEPDVIEQRKANLAHTKAATDRTPEFLKHLFDVQAITAQQYAWLMNLPPEKRNINVANMMDRLNSAKAGAPTGTSAIAAQDAANQAAAAAAFEAKYGISPKSSAPAQQLFDDEQAAAIRARVYQQEGIDALAAEALYKKGAPRPFINKYFTREVPPEDFGGM